MKKIKTKISVSMSIVMIISLFVINYTPITIKSAEKEKNYIIITNSKKASKTIEKKYGTFINEQKQNTDLLKDENILVSKMTASEAEEVEKDSQVQKVEEDIKVDASTKRTSLSKKKSFNVSKKKRKDNSSWNLKSINADSEESIPSKKVKVALLDSGVDFQENINVKERINLITEDKELSPMFEDESSHGTSIASLIVSEGSEVKGVNQNVELYSARILDGEKQAPISRVIEGIYWAIDKGVNIINISFGTSQYSEALKQAIDDAEANGILVIAAAGNQGEKGSDNVQYPAAFDNVLAVGSVNANAEVSVFSSTGKEIDIVAPGEAVRATGSFGETMVTSGTSMSVPHVVGVASRIWQKDLSKSNKFVSSLIKESARPLGDEKEYGNGLVDYKYAKDMYNTAEKQYKEKKDIQLKTNEKKIKTYTNQDETKVEGLWSGSNHQKYLTDNGVNIPAMKKGAAYPDTSGTDSVGISGMTENPDFHGLYERRNADKEKVNYLASYRFMIKIGNQYGNGKTYTAVSQSDIPGLTTYSYNRIRSAMSKIQGKTFFKNYSNANKKAFIFGVAMHTSTDTFAHSTYRNYNGQWYSITHAINETKGQFKENEADNPNFVPARFKMAYRAERNTLYRYQGKRSDVAVCHDFHAANAPDYYPSNPTFKVKRLSSYGSEVHLSDANVIKHYAIINYN
ncbi:S8 family peptidase [Anaerostipes sp.]|uniref:S8 family peptidase n=1 Tax=Anaerostipes sp. TaxID=1872530 RepID=UPI0025B826A9|nr:S8 family serine peptidase [Anaerostipes sp.]MBS7007280.1 S8 family serine peptidase [Anaerostipes sp.]